MVQQSLSPRSSRSLLGRIYSPINLILVLVVLALSPSVGHADEPSEAFIEAMRQSGYFDLAFEYLDRAEKDPLVTKEFRTRIPLERSRTLVASLNRIRDLDIWETRLKEAQDQLTLYANQATDKASQADAQQEQAGLYRYLARVYMKRSESDRLTKTEKEALFTNARGMLEKALAGYTQSRASYNALLKQLRTEKTGPDKKAKRNRELETGFLKSRLSMAVVQEGIADTFSDTAKQNEYLEKAADEFNDMWLDFSHRAQGVDACLFAAKTHVKLKQYKKALERVDDILLFPKSTDFLAIKRKALVVAVDCWASEKKYPAERIIKDVKPLVDSLSRRNKSHPEWLKVQLELAKAYRARATALKKKNGKPSEVNRWNKEASTLARSVSRVPSDVRTEARELLAEWNINVNEIEDPEEKPTFPVYKDKAREQAGELEVFAIQASQLKAKIRAAKGNERETEKLNGELEAVNAQLEEQAEKIHGTLRRCLTLADDTTPREDVNFIRYLQCFTFYSSGQFFESVVIGEFLLDRYATVTWTQKAAGLVVKSYPRMSTSTDAPSIGGSDATEASLAKVCEQVIKRWPGTPEAIRAADTMASQASKAKDYPAAIRYMETVPKNDPARASLGLRIGTGVWFEYSSDEVKDPAKLQSAHDLLNEGVSGYNKETLTYSAALGALLLTKALDAKGESDKAVARLESPEIEIAPLDLVRQKHPAIQGSRQTIFEKETYKTAITVYLKAMQQGQSEKWIKKTEDVLEGLKTIYDREGDQGQAQLINVYKVVATQLVDRFGEIRDAEQRVDAAQSIEQFLTSLANKAEDPNTVLWAGSTMLEVGDELGNTNEKLRKRLYVSASEAMERATEIGFEGHPDEAKLVSKLKRLQAIAMRGAGQFKQAIGLLEETLRANPSFLQAQIDAAETLQQWGESASLANAYAEALGGRGTYEDEEGRERKLVWGWKQLMQLTRGKEKLDATYRQAYLGRIECMYEYGVIANNQKAITSARKEIANIKRRDPEFGSERWLRRLEELDNQINNN